MRLLFDTHLLLWAAANSPRLPKRARALLGPGSGTRRVFSAASVWEVAVKRSLERPGLAVDPRALRRGLLDNGYEEMPVTGLHAAGVAVLPWLHRDPFDRLLVAQSLAEELPLVTADRALAGYPTDIRIV